MTRQGRRSWIPLGLALILVGCASLPKPEGPPGISQRDVRLLESSGPDRLVIEVDRVEGTNPRPRALTRFLQRTALYLDHPGGIELVVDGVIPAADWPDSPAGFKDLAVNQRSVRPPGKDQAGLHLLYGPRWKNYRGYTWARGSMLRRNEDYNAALILLLQDAITPVLWVTGVKQEASVLVHELGHALGLATDPGHSFQGHCTRAHCLMYNGVDARTFALYFFPTLLTGYLPLDFCADCREDLYEAHGAVPPGQRTGQRGNGALPEGSPAGSSGAGEAER